MAPLLFLIYISNMPQAADSELLLYADDIRLVFQHSITKTVEENLKRYFSTYVD